MRHLYTVLLYGCLHRPANQVAKTRFKAWWSLAGWPVELAASLINENLDFAAVFKVSEEQDSKAAGVVGAVRLLSAKFGKDKFRARAIRTLLNDADRAEETLRRSGFQNAEAIAQAKAAIARADGVAEMLEGLTGKKNTRSLATAVIGKLLSGIVDRPVVIQSATEEKTATRGILRSSVLDGNTRFEVELQGGMVGKNMSVFPVAPLPSGAVSLTYPTTPDEPPPVAAGEEEQVRETPPLRKIPKNN
jgi:hypothetical protein